MSKETITFRDIETEKYKFLPLLKVLFFRRSRY